MSKRRKQPKRAVFQGNARAGRYKHTPVRRAGLGRTSKSTAEPTHSLWRDDCALPVFSGTMDLCCVELSRRMPGYSADHLLTVGGWTIKPYEKPEKQHRADGAGSLIQCPRCNGRGCADCDLDPTKPANKRKEETTCP